MISESILFESEIIFKIILAAILGGIIGLEREIHYKPAGLRTHILVCIGATLFAITSITFKGLSADPSRIAANIVTGIGFLGAGVIFMSKNKLHGITTAADLWVIAAIGLAVGVGLFLTAIITTIIIYIILMLGKIEKKKLRKRKAF